MLVYKVAELPLEMLEAGDEIASAVTYRDFILVITRRGQVYKMVFNLSEQWEQ